MLKDEDSTAMTIKISALDKRLLNNGITGWRIANSDIDLAIESENWSAIEGAQHSRSVHANVIALIVHKYTDITLEQGVNS